MSQLRKTGRKSKRLVTVAAGRRLPRSVPVVLGIIVVAALCFGWWYKGSKTDTTPALAVQASGNVTNPPATTTTPRSGFEKLTGHWQRPDGGYILEIRGAEPGGKVTAAYYNPRPIYVARAEASQDGGTITLFIELRDMKYPGSTYTLTYDPVDDRLKGSYFQAAIKQTFDVHFVRLKT